MASASARPPAGPKLGSPPISLGDIVPQHQTRVRDLYIRLPDSYYVVVEKGTERAFSGKYWDHKGEGLYRCIVCRRILFSSLKRLDSIGYECGWLTFSGSEYYREPQGEKATVYESVVGDDAFGLNRNRIACSLCRAHLGYVFERDLPQTGNNTTNTNTNTTNNNNKEQDAGGRGGDTNNENEKGYCFCVNSAAVDFDPFKKEARPDL